MRVILIQHETHLPFTCKPANYNDSHHETRTVNSGFLRCLEAPKTVYHVGNLLLLLLLLRLTSHEPLGLIPTLQ